MPADSIVFRPLSRRGGGSGHLRRCWTAALALGKRARIVLDGEEKGGIPRNEWSAVIPGFPGDADVDFTGGPGAAGTPSPPSEGAGNGKSGVKNAALPGFTGALVVFDRRSTDEAELEEWAGSATPVLLDDAGTARKTAPYVVDAIPGAREGEANLSDPGLMDLPERRRDPDASGPVLVSFGGHDPAGLTLGVLSSLIASGIYPAASLAATLPGDLAAEDLPVGVKCLGRPGDLKNLLGDFGMVVCSYGLTAWEAVAAGCAVAVVDPTPYHESLSRRAGFPRFERFLEEAAESPEKARRSMEAAAGRLSREIGAGGGRSAGLAGLFSGLEAPVPRCAACGRPLPPVIARFPERSYYRCPDCGITGLYRFRTRRGEYGASYFVEEYRAQYGRTYLEDFDSIKAAASPRLRAIGTRVASGGKILDVGCAFGPFLAAARQAGFAPYGFDVSDEGVEYVRRELGIAAAAGSFPVDNPTSAFGVDSFDAVTMWYVIEHFADLRKTLDAIASLVKKGGVFAFSTPNGAGISGKRDYRRFLENGPPDHYTVWTPKTARSILARHGFRVYSIRSTGHHPERFGAVGKPGGFVFRAAGIASRILKLGDTFEVYAVKET